MVDFGPSEIFGLNSLQAKLSDYEIEESVPGCIDPSKMDTILPLVKTALKSVKSGVCYVHV